MMQKIIRRILGKKPSNTLRAVKKKAVKEISFKDHQINQDHISKNAIKVAQTLQQAGYDAFIVGGAVRDLILGIVPKDFDVATNATPDQVQAVFRKSRLIGRRFQIVHVTFYGGHKPEIIEVSTFRAMVNDEGEHMTESGRILRDNIWGSHSEDAARRDFTINALYYNPSNSMVLDYHGGMYDIKERLIRMIGDPEKRFREDPIRMLRAVRFAAKTGFTIEAQTLAPIQELAPLIHDVPSARLFDEICENGAIVSEVMPGVIAMPHRFLTRNRLIAALSQSTLVVEAAFRSGSLRTARDAAELMRPVMAIPGPINSPSSEGCHRLIGERAAELVTSVADAIELITSL
jgi:poly(A) polymerase